MEYRFMVVLEPKRGYKEGLYTQIMLVEATNKAEAIKAAIELGMGGDVKYFKKPKAELFGFNKLYAI